MAVIAVISVSLFLAKISVGNEQHFGCIIYVCPGLAGDFPFMFGVQGWGGF